MLVHGFQKYELVEDGTGRGGLEAYPGLRYIGNETC